jgi:hypothetical protein
MSTCDQAGFQALYCDNRGVPSNYTIGGAMMAANYKACEDLCKGDPKCKAYTFNPVKQQCTKKSARQFIYQAGVQSGPVTNVVSWWVPPCTPEAQTAGQYKCNAGIASSANLDAPVYKSAWTACQAMCSGDTKCKGWTWNPNGLCQKKKDATYFYNQHYLSGARKATSGSGSGAGSGGGADGGSSGTSSSTATTTPTAAPAPPTPAPTTPPAPDWWRQMSPLGVEWWIVVAVGLVLLLMVGSVGMMMMMSMSG